MDFRSTCTLIALVALAAGIVTGVVEYQSEKSALRSASPDAGGGGADAAPTVTARQDAARAAPRRERRSPNDAGKESAGNGAPAAAAAGYTAPTAPDAPSLSLSDDEETEIAALEKLLAEHRFAEAADGARRMAARTRDMARARAQQVEAKALVLEKLLPSGAEAPPQLQEVVQSNRSVHLVRKLEETPDGLRLHLVSGGSTVLRREDILEIRPADAAAYRERLGAELARRVEKYDQAIDLYLKGVRAYYRVGLRDEGFRLMERIFELDDGDLVLSVLAEEESRELLAYWRVARGRGIEALKRRAASAAVTGSAASATVVAGDPPSSSGAGEPESSGPADPGSVAKVHELIGQADALYRGALGVEGRDGDLRKAYDALRKAQDLLLSLPGTPEVRTLRVRVGQKLFDLSRALPFDA